MVDMGLTGIRWYSLSKVTQMLLRSSPANTAWLDAIGGMGDTERHKEALGFYGGYDLLLYTYSLRITAQSRRGERTCNSREEAKQINHLLRTERPVAKWQIYENTETKCRSRDDGSLPNLGRAHPTVLIAFRSNDVY